MKAIFDPSINIIVLGKRISIYLIFISRQIVLGSHLKQSDARGLASARAGEILKG